MSLTTVELTAHEFIVSLDNEALEIFKHGKAVNIQLRNPHKVGEYDMPTLSLIKVLMDKLKQLKPRKQMPTDAEIKKTIRQMTFDTSTDTEMGFMLEVYKKAWDDSK